MAGGWLGVKSMPLEKKAQLTMQGIHLKAGITHLQMSLAKENTGDFTSTALINLKL